MMYWIVILAVIGILSTGVVWGTDAFFFMVARAALRSASAQAGTEVMGFLHLFADARMPIVGASAIVSQTMLIAITVGEARWLHAVSLVALLLLLAVYGKLSKPINRLQTQAARTGQPLDNARQLQSSWDRSLAIRLPLLAIALLAQCLALLLRPTCL